MVKQMALPKVISDHKPIMLESGDWETNRSYLKFEKMWLQTEGFLDRVKWWRQAYVFRGNPDFILIQKLKMLKKDIIVWNRAVYGKVEAQRNKALDDLLTEEQDTEISQLTSAELSKMITIKVPLA